MVLRKMVHNSFCCYSYSLIHPPSNVLTVSLMKTCLLNFLFSSHRLSISFIAPTLLPCPPAATCLHLHPLSLLPRPLAAIIHVYTSTHCPLSLLPHPPKRLYVYTSTHLPAVPFAMPTSSYMSTPPPTCPLCPSCHAQQQL